MLEANEVVTALANAAVGPELPDEPGWFGRWCITINGEWRWRRWVLGARVAPVYGAACTICGLWTTDDEELKSRLFILAIAFAILAAVTALAGAVAAEVSTARQNRLETHAATTRLRLARQGIANTLTNLQAKLDHSDYRLSLMACVRCDDDTHAMKAIVRDRFHPVTEDSGQPRISALLKQL